MYVLSIAIDWFSFFKYNDNLIEVERGWRSEEGKKSSVVRFLQKLICMFRGVTSQESVKNEIQLFVVRNENSWNDYATSTSDT